MKAGDLISYKGIEDVVEEVLGDEVRIQNQSWNSEDDDEDIGFWIWVRISDLDQ